MEYRLLYNVLAFEWCITHMLTICRLWGEDFEREAPSKVGKLPKLQFFQNGGKLYLLFGLLIHWGNTGELCLHFGTTLVIAMLEYDKHKKSLLLSLKSLWASLEGKVVAAVSSIVISIINLFLDPCVLVCYGINQLTHWRWNLKA